MAATANYSWTKPNIGGDTGTWGTELNADLDSIDSALFAVSGVANGALALSGGTMTGPVQVLSSSMTAFSTSEGGSTVTLFLHSANTYYVNVTGNLTFAISDFPPAGVVVAYILRLNGAGAHTITWWPNLKWPGAAGPPVFTNGMDIIGLLFDGTSGNTYVTGIVQNVG